MRGPKGYVGKGKDYVMVMWGNPFVLTTFKILGLFNIFPLLFGGLLTCLNFTLKIWFTI